MADGKAFLLLGILVFYGALSAFLASGNYTGLYYDNTTYNYLPLQDNSSVGENPDNEHYAVECTIFESIFTVFGGASNCVIGSGKPVGHVLSDNELNDYQGSIGFSLKNIVINIEGFGWASLIFLTPLFLTLIYIITSSYEVSIFGFKIGGSGGG